MPVVEIISKTCLDCYKCLRKCAVHAIRVQQGHARIVAERCLFCGQCVRECPRRAIRVRRGADEAMQLIRSGDPVIASVAIMESSRIAPIHTKIMFDLLEMGFAGVETTTRIAGPVWTRVREIARSRDRATIRSGCPSIVALVEQCYPEALDILSPIVSYAEAHARLIKARCRARAFQNVRVVNIAPEPAILGERIHSDFPSSLDGALTLKEMWWWIRHHQGARRQIKGAALQIDEAPPALEWLRDILPIYGIRECCDFFRRVPRGISNETIIEMTACRYGCALGSPWVLARVEEASAYLYPPGSPLAPEPDEDTSGLDLSRSFRNRYVEQPRPTDEELTGILRRAGKRSRADEINCGACGYDTCRAHAVAVFQGMAEVEMCIPHMRRQAQEASSVIENTANGVLLVDRNLAVQFANPALRRMFGLERDSVVGRPTRQVFNNDMFERALAAGGRLAAVGTSGDLTYRMQIFPIRDQPLLGAVIVDISAEARAGEEFRRVREATLDRAQEVIGRQMKTAQEIAGLLGETTAETKALLVKLMDLVRRETVA